MGCIKHPHGKYEDHRVTIPVSIAENETIVDEIAGIELYDENSSRFVKVFNVNNEYVYENTIYFDRMVYLSEIVIYNSGKLNYVMINDVEEDVFINKVKKSVNRVNIKASVNRDVIPSDIIYMDLKTVRDPSGSASWQK